VRGCFVLGFHCFHGCESAESQRLVSDDGRGDFQPARPGFHILGPHQLEQLRWRYWWIRPRTQSTSAWFGVALIPVGSLRTYQVVVQVTDWPEGKAA